MESYVLGEELGRGAGGAVRAAVHRRLGLQAAIKRVSGRHLHEAELLAHLDHRHVVRIFDTGVDAQGGWIAMERAQGTLQLPADLPALQRSLDAALAGLAAAHAAGILHRDIKPSNVLVRDDGSVMLADFGLVGSQGGGTPAYLAPECFGGPPVGPASDLYSVGCLAHALLCGRPPYGSGGWDVLARAHASGDLPDLSPRFPIPVAVAAWVQTLLQTSPLDRYQHAADARRALALACQSPVSVGSSRPEQLPLQATVTRAGGAAGAPASFVREAEAPAPCTLPERCPEPHPPRPPGQAGAGLLGCLSVPFVGREAALDTLWRALLRVERTGAPWRVRLDGPLGSGRSRLGQVFTQLAREAGCALPGSSNAARVRVAWLGDRVAAAPLQGRVLQISCAGPADEVLALEPFDASGCRAVLARWVHLRSDHVADLADRCHGDLGLAVDTVRHGFSEGLLRPGPRGLASERPLPLDPARVARARAQLRPLPRPLQPCLELAAVIGERVGLERLRGLDDGADDLCSWMLAHGHAISTSGGFRWVSGATRAAAMPATPAALHLRVASSYNPASDDFFEVWKCGEQLLAAGALSQAVPLIFSASVKMIGAGKMVPVARTLSALERALQRQGWPSSDPVWGQLWMDMAQLGPTHLGFKRCRALQARALALATTHRQDSRWAKLVRRTRISLWWLLNLMLLPNEAAPLVSVTLNDPERHCACYQDLGYYLLARGCPEAALAAFERGVQVARAEGNTYVALTTQAAAGVAKRQLGHPDSVAHFQAARQALHAASFHSADGDLACAIGDAHRFAGALELALPAYRQAIHLSAQGEARADLSFELGLALGLGEAGQQQRALLRVRACIMAESQGPSWDAMLALHELVLEAELEAAGADGLVDVESAAQAADPERSRSVRLADIAHALEQTGYIDPDLSRALDRLRSADPTLSDVAERFARSLRRRSAANASTHQPSDLLPPVAQPKP